MTYECIKTYRVNNNAYLAPIFVAGEEYEGQKAMIVNCAVHTQIISKYGSIVLFPQVLLNKHFIELNSAGLQINIKRK